MIMSKRDNILVFSEYKVPRAVGILAIPSMLGMLINIIYNLADTFFVGQTGDSNQVAAVSVAMPVFLFFLALGNLFGVGGCAFISRSLGEGQRERIKSISSFCIYSGLAISVIVAAGFIIFRRPLLYLVGASDNTIDFACDYLFWISLGAPFVTLSIIACNLVRGEGAAKESMIGMVLGQIVNIVLDPVFILGAGDKLFGLSLPFGFGLGVAGAAMATVIGNVVSVLYFIFYFIKGRSILSITPKRFSAKNGIAKGVINVGIPASLNNLLMSLSNIVINMFLTTYGDYAVAAMGVAMKANLLVVMLQIGLAQGIQPLIGYCYGARNYPRMKKTITFGTMCNVVIGATVTLFYILFRHNIIAMFIDDETVIEYGVKMITALMVPGTVIGIMFVINNAFQAMGKGFQSLILAAGRQGLVFLPMLFIMDRLFELEGIIWAQPIADFCCIALSIVMFYSTMKKLPNPDNRA